MIHKFKELKVFDIKEKIHKHTRGKFWAYNNQFFFFQSARAGDPHTHQISNVDPHHEGLYTCVVGNGKNSSDFFFCQAIKNKNGLFGHPPFIKHSILRTNLLQNFKHISSVMLWFYWLEFIAWLELNIQSE